MYRTVRFFNICFYCTRKRVSHILPNCKAGVPQARLLSSSINRITFRGTVTTGKFGTTERATVFQKDIDAFLNANHCRTFSISAVLREDSKVDQQLEILKDEKVKKTDEKAESSLPASQSRISVVKSEKFVIRIWIKIKKELKHYYNGFKLFFFETKISLKLLRKITNGDALTRREKKQLLRTVSDIFRLVPFSIFVIIPFMEFLLPFAIKLFPGMLPSTFEEKKTKEVRAKQRFKLKLEMAKFLQDTVEQMAVRRSSSTSETAQKFADFMGKVRQGDLELSNEEILKFSKAFRDSLMLDNLEKQQLMAICKILNIRPIGNTNLLRFQIKLKMRNIKADDLMIKQEGAISSLEVSDLQSLVRERGMRAYGVSKQRLVTQLEEWLDLHLNDKVPLSLLLLSRTLYMPPSEGGLEPTATETLKATISSLPSETSDTAKQRLAELESGEVDNAARLENVRREQEAIKQEALEREQSLLQAQQTAMKAEEEEKERILDTALHDFPPGYVLAETRSETVPEVTVDMMKVVEEALTDLAETKSKVSEERDDLNELVQEIQDYNASLQEALETSESKVKVTRGSRLLSRYLQYSLKKLQPTVEKIEEKRQHVKEEIQQLSEEKKEALDERTASVIEGKIQSHEGTVATIDEVRAAMKALTEVSDEELLSEVAKIIDPDQDGIVEIDTVIKAIEFMSTYSEATADSKNSPEALTELIRVLTKELQLKQKLASVAAASAQSSPPQQIEQRN